MPQTRFRQRPVSDSRYTKKHGMLARLLDGVLVWTFRITNRVIPWHRLPKWIGLVNLIALRVELRRYNLHDTDGDLTHPKPDCPLHPGPKATAIRTANGTQNDLQYPAMGCRFSRFGRNMASTLPVEGSPDLLHPNPLEISQRLLARKEFKSAETLNLLAAAWIQFQVHDWFGHENERLDAGQDIRVPKAGDWQEREMVIPKTKPDATNSLPLNSRFPAFRNKLPQWWDASQVYGEAAEETISLRTDPTTKILCAHGKLYIDPKGFLPTDPKSGRTLSGFTDNWWLGLEILHSLFAMEHNAICERIQATEPQLTDQEIFEAARLVNCAVMAKIHTVEWTPGILAHPAIKPGLDANWMGLLGHFFGEGTTRTLAGFLPEGIFKDVLTGTPLSEVDHHGAPYSLTEEFNAVYRLHPLIPDEVQTHNSDTRSAGPTYTMKDISFTGARAPFRDGLKMEDVIYSFGIAHPGAITIKNYPAFLRELKLPPDPETNQIQHLDLAAVDILRDRERGVPRYNEFRRQLRMKPAEDWKEMAGGDEELAKELKEIYQDNLEDVDTMVGMFCEPLPKGFGFSDTAFRIFILMASRRLKSDRFFTTDFTSEFYTQEGLDWIRNTGMKEVILRHHPKLAPAFQGVRNPFAPWRRLP